MVRIIFVIFIMFFYIPILALAADEKKPKITNVEVVSNKEVSEQPEDECFIATAAYGSKFEPHVATLRQFRDEFLLTNKTGRTFVDFYYKHSPPIADYIRDNDLLKQIVRLVLLPFVSLAYICLNAPIFLGLLLIIPLIFKVLMKRRLV